VARLTALPVTSAPAASSESVGSIRLVAGWDEGSIGWWCHPCLVVIEHEQPYG